MQNSILTIIVTYNGSSWIEQCLQSLKNSKVATDVLVIDNASTDNTVSIINTQFKDVQSISLKSNKGFGAANNVGLKIAQAKNYEFVFLLNQDAWVDANCLHSLITVARGNKELGILSPFHYNYDGTKTETYFQDFVLKEYTEGFISDESKGELKEWYSSSFIHAAAWLMPMATVTKVGGFDPLFFYTGEDKDYVQRLHFRGLKVGFVSAAKFYHQGSNAGLENPAENKLLFKNAEILKFKNPNASTAGVLTLLTKNSLKYGFIASKKDKIPKMQADVFKELSKALPKLLRSRGMQLTDSAYL